MNLHTLTIDETAPSSENNGAIAPDTGTPVDVIDESVFGPLVLKDATNATANIHELLHHVRRQGITWVPDSLGINEEGKQVLTYLEGTVPHDLPYWIWKDSILIDIACRLREWHDATAGFRPKTNQWAFETDEPHEVICHNDFAPYNCVFNNGKFTGLINFALCSPGSRLWDIAYTAYRFVPLMPDEHNRHTYVCSPFGIAAMHQRLAIFLDAYANGDDGLHYDRSMVLSKTCNRLLSLAQWPSTHAPGTGKKKAREDPAMYSLHAEWIMSQL
jgi:thiamine kinase-like enzyme